MTYKTQEALKLADELDAEFAQGRISNHTGRKAAQFIREALAEQPAQCRHRIADARNPVVKSGYLCVDCGALFAAADHTKQPAQPSKPVTQKLLEAKQNFERNFGPHAMADWIYSDLLEWLDDTSPQPAQQQEPVQEIARLHDRIKDLEWDVEFLSQPAQQKPVAWMDGYRNIYSLEEKAAGCEDAVIPLVPATLQHWSDCAVHNEPAYPAGKCDCGGYTSPPAQRKPLTDDEIRAASLQAGMQEHYMGFHSGFIRFARAIEAAHGIK